MKKVLLLSGISYLLLVSCGTSVSLTDNYFEDENYYDPTLPLPLFALPNNAPVLEELGEDDLDAIWQGTTANGYNFPNTPTYTQNYWTTGFGRINSPYWSINSMGSWNTFGWNSPMGLSPWGNFWMPMGYNPFGMAVLDTTRTVTILTATILTDTIPTGTIPICTGMATATIHTAGIMVGRVLETPITTLLQDLGLTTAALAPLNTAEVEAEVQLMDAPLWTPTKVLERALYALSSN